jgi:hypothetical protein
MHKVLGIPMVIFSLLSLPIGGGCIIGSILAFIAGMMAIEWPKSFSDTFIGKMIRAVRLDPKVFGVFFNDPDIMQSAVLALLFAGITMGFGNAIYVFNVNLIKTKATDAYEILLQGKTGLDTMTITNAVSFIGITFVRWIALSIILYVIIVKLKGHEGDYGKIAYTVAFAFVPLSIQAFLPMLFSNEPYLSFSWPFAVSLISIFWVALVVLVFTKNVFELKIREALGVTLLAGALYLLFESSVILVITSALLVSLPGVILQFTATSLDAILLVFSLVIMVAILLGALSKKRT